jgi:hypothetical protein
LLHEKLKSNKCEIILNAACKLISQIGFKGISLQKISNEVWLNKGSLFQQLPSQNGYLSVQDLWRHIGGDLSYHFLVFL